MQHFANCLQALDDEIGEVKKGKRKPHQLSEGQYIGQRKGQHLYSFSLDGELTLVADSPIELVHDATQTNGQVISIVEYDIFLALNEFIGPFVEQAKLYSDPTGLLWELKNRLQSDDITGLNNLASMVLKKELTCEDPHSLRALSLLQKVGGSEVPLPNEEQTEAIGHILANKVSFIWGPPGTGKTRTLGQAATALVAEGESVLVVAHSNVAVDTAMMQVASGLVDTDAYQSGQILRFGYYHERQLIEQYPQLHVRGILEQTETELIDKLKELEEERNRLMKQIKAESRDSGVAGRLHEDFEKVLNRITEINNQLIEAEKGIVHDATVVGCTLSKAALATEIYSRTFDTVLLDEASMAYIPQCLYAASLARKRIAFFGDFRQLAPIATADTAPVKNWLKTDVFEHAGIISKVEHNISDERLVMLRRQYRMHREIADIPNTYFYQNKLINDPSAQSEVQEIADKDPESGKPVVLYDLKHLYAGCQYPENSYSRFNILSGLIAAQLASRLIASGEDNIGIICPYGAQAKLIRKLCLDLNLDTENVTVSTVHRFQGSERNAIILDTVESHPMNKPGKPFRPQKADANTGDELRLINVALTRAKGKLVVISNTQYMIQTLGRDNAPKEVLKHLTDTYPRNSVRTDSALWDDWNSAQVQMFQEPSDAETLLARDLYWANAASLDWPEGMSVSSSLARLLHDFVDNGGHMIPSKRAEERFQLNTENEQHIEKTAASGVIRIEDSVLWLISHKQHQIHRYAVRLALPKTLPLLFSYLDLDGAPSTVTKAASRNHQRLANASEVIPNGQNPLPQSRCSRCQAQLWPDLNYWPDHKGYHRLSCVGCSHWRQLTTDEATELAFVAGARCSACGNGRLKGFQPRHGSIKLRCESCKQKNKLNTNLVRSILHS